jgi:hemerythrin-like domain-containing protein
MSSHHLMEERVLRDLMELYQQPAFRHVCEALTARRDALRAATEDLDGGDIVHKMRGASGELHEVLRYFTDPEKLYADVRKRTLNANAARAAHAA